MPLENYSWVSFLRPVATSSWYKDFEALYWPMMPGTQFHSTEIYKVTSVDL